MFTSRISGSAERPKTFGELNSHSIADFYKSSDFVKAEVSSAGKVIIHKWRDEVFLVEQETKLITVLQPI